MLSLERQNELRASYRARHPGWAPATEVYAGLVRQYLPADGRLLDLGCGRGGLVEQLEHPLARMVGIDPDWHSLREHRLALPRAAGLSGALPLAGGRFDVVAASWVWEHLAAPEKDFAEVARVLAPGGVSVFITPNARHPLVALNRVVGRLGRVQAAVVRRLYGRAGADTFPAYYRANDAARLQRLAAGAGLTLAAVTAVADPTYLAFAAPLVGMAERFERRLPPDRAIHLVGVLRKPG